MKQHKNHLLAVLVLLCGCMDEGPAYSPNVSTLDMDVAIEATDLGKGAIINLTVRSPLGALRLTGGDSLKLEMGGAPLVFTDLLNEYQDPFYRSEAPSLTSDMLLTIHREKDTSIVDYVVPVPPVIGLKAEPIVGNGPLVLLWNAAPGALHDLTLRVEGTCIKSISRNLPNDVGSYKIINAELFPSDPSNPAACPLNATLNRNEVTQGRLLPDAPLYQFYANITIAETIAVDWQQ